jgi:hypothetical protein
MKSLTARERLMVTIMPAALIMLIYFFFFSRPAGEKLKDLRREVEVAQGRVPSGRERADVLAELKPLDEEVSEKRIAARSRIERSESILAFWNDPDAKAKGGEFIGNLLAANGVVLIEESVASEEDRGDFITLFEPLPSAELWLLRLAGTYDSMRRTIAAIGKTEFPLVPAGIEMESMVEGNQTIHLWNLWICR